MLGKRESQFSLTRAALSTRGCAKSKFVSKRWIALLVLGGVTGQLAGGQTPSGTVVAIGQASAPPTNTDIVAVAAGTWHSVALRNDRTVLAWGSPNGGRLLVPPGLTGVTAIAAGEWHSLALKQDGTVVGWGGNNQGQLTIPPQATNVVAIACGRLHSLAVQRDGAVLAWGYNFFGQSVPPPGLSNAVAVAAGDSHSLVLRRDGTVFAWGIPNAITQPPEGLTNVMAIAAGASHSLALTSNQMVIAWGENSYGQTTPPPNLSNVIAVAAGEYHSLALQADGTVVGWGNNRSGQTTIPLGLGYVLAIGGGMEYSLLLKIPAPTIVNHPATVVTNPGAIISFSVSASGGEPFTYQWQKDQISIPGATSATLSMTNVQPRDMGKYRAVVTGFGGKAVSLPAALFFPETEPLVTNSAVLPPNMTTQSMSYGDAILAVSNFRMQQAYGASLFPTGALLITEFRFRPDISAHAFTATIADMQINLSTSLRPAEALSSASWSDNIGEDDTIAFRGAHTISSQFIGPLVGPKEFDIAFPLTRPFLYIPGDGNLLVEIRNFSGSEAIPISAQLVYGDQASQASGNLTAYHGWANSSVDAIQIRYIRGLPPPPPEPPRLPIDHRLVVPRNLSLDEGNFGSETLGNADYRVQQAYGALQFPTGNLAVTELRFRPDALLGRAFSTTVSNIEISLSTTAPRADGLSAIFAWNTGPDETVVFNGPLNITSAFGGPRAGPKDFDIVVPLQRSFVFNREAGNLLVDIRNYSGSSDVSLLSGQRQPQDGCARLHALLGQAGGMVDTGVDVLQFLVMPTNAPPPPQRPGPTPGHVVVPWQAAYEETPFGSGTLISSGARVQEVYSSVNFPIGPLALTELRFRPDSQYGQAFSNAVVDLSIRLSTTPRQPDGLGGALENVGRDETVVFEGLTSLSSQFVGTTNGLKVFDIAIPFTRPFIYEPGEGNLLVDVITFAGAPNASLLSGQSSLTDSASRLRSGPGAGYGPTDTGAEALQLAYAPTNRPSPPVPAPSPAFEATIQPANLLTQETAFASVTLSASAYRAQQLYHSAYFPTGGILISELRFRPHGTAGWPFYTKAPMIQINLSVTRRSADALSPVYAENTGVNEIVVFRNWVDLESRFDGPPGALQTFDVRIPLAMPYLYDPSQGNLLIDIRNFAGSGACPMSGQASTTDGCGRVAGNLGDSSGAVDTAIDAMQFGYLPTNAPARYAARVLRGPYLQLASSTNITVRWKTDEFCEGQVRYDVSTDTLNWSANDLTVTNHHQVTLTGLTPGTRYYYSVGSLQKVAASGVSYYFVTAPPTPRPVRIWVIGDADSNSQLGAKVRDAYYSDSGQRHTDVWLLLGDNGSGRDWDNNAVLFDVYDQLLRCTPVWPTIGNHEVVPEGTDGWIPYLATFNLPAQGEAGGVASGTERYYSFDFGNVHFVSLDSETSDKSTGGIMLTWLEHDLAANTNDWLIAYWHSPPYSHGSHNSDGEGNLIQMREWVVPVLENYGVDLILCGHSHSYERSYLLDGHYGLSSSLAPFMIKDAGSGQPRDTGAYLKSSFGPGVRQGAVYVVAGCSAAAGVGSLDYPAMFVSLRRLGSVVIDIDGSRLDARFLRETGSVDDHFTILKGVGPEALRFVTFRVADAKVMAAWKSIAGQAYLIEKSAGLNPPRWVPATDEIIATGATSFWTGAMETNATGTYYRIVRTSR